MREGDLTRELGRMIRGELTSAEVKRLAKEEGFESFSELCETRLPEDLQKVRLGTKDVLARIDRYRRRGTDLYELWFWADELYNISFNHRIAYEPRSEELIMSSLSAISVVANERLFPNQQKVARAIEYVRACLIRRRKFRLRNIFLRIFEDLELANLANKNAAEPEDETEGDGAPPEPGAAPGPTRWADVVLLDRPFAPGTDIYADYNWVIAFTVTTRELYEEEQAEGEAGEDGAEPRGPEPGASAADGPAPGDDAPFRFPIPGWREPEDDDAPGDAGTVRPARLRPTPREDGDEIDRLPALRRLVPNFDFERLRPRYLYDGDGIAEIVLDAPAIGPAEVRYATKLFCLANRIRACKLDGEELNTLVVRPGAGKRSEKP
jgi:hypothetical protein